MPIGVIFDLFALLVGGVGHTIEKGVNESNLEQARSHRLGKLRDELAACPLRPILGSPDGPVGFEGHARPLALQPAPLSGRPVIGYRLRIDGVFDDGDSKATRRLLDLASVLEFELVESTGQVARIQPGRCLPLLAPEPVVPLELAAVIKPPLAPILDRALISTSDLVTAYELHAVEHLLEPGEPVFAFGFARHELDPGGASLGYRDLPRKTTLVPPPPDGVLILADQHRDALCAALEAQWELLPWE